MSLSRSIQRKVAAFEQRRAGIGRSLALGREDVVIVAANHQSDDLGVRLGARFVGRDIAAVAKHCALIGEFGYLVHPVRNVEDRQTFRTQPPEH